MVKTGKIISFNIFSLLTAINIFLVYFSSGIMAVSMTAQFWKSVWVGFSLLFMIWILTLLVNLSYVTSRALYKKNLLRISFFAFLITFLVSFVYFAIDWWNYGFAFLRFILLAFYLALTIISYLMLKDLYILIDSIFYR